MNKRSLYLFLLVLLGLTWQRQPTSVQADWAIDLPPYQVFIPQVYSGGERIISKEVILTPSQVASWCFSPCSQRGVFEQPVGAPKNEVVFAGVDCFITFFVPQNGGSTANLQLPIKIFHFELSDGLIHIHTGPTTVSDPCWALFRLDVPIKQSLGLSVTQVRDWCSGLCNEPYIQQPGGLSEIAYFPSWCGQTTFAIPTNWSFAAGRVNNQQLLLYYGTQRNEVQFMTLQKGAPLILSNVCWAYMTLTEI